MTARVVEQLAARGLRLMAVYENLRTAVDVMAVEIEAQHQLADQLGEDEGARVVRADAGRMTSAIATERDRAAHIVSAIFGEHAFKTGRVHAAYYQVLDGPSNATGKGR